MIEREERKGKRSPRGFNVERRGKRKEEVVIQGKEQTGGQGRETKKHWSGLFGDSRA